jgi:hypothetical protein
MFVLAVGSIALVITGDSALLGCICSPSPTSGGETRRRETVGEYVARLTDHDESGSHLAR